METPKGLCEEMTKAFMEAGEQLNNEQRSSTCFKLMLFSEVQEEFEQLQLENDKLKNQNKRLKEQK
ncbi:hypothetical protein COLO4_24983 [Corchorus olitorius]|uniref:Uncharacterized protein n=1 Tax=Corchorus olitorius TaxID=93759 RepID=A0A1R3I5U0_9ROSI|nr:hypothetical protein COLO4_24983 [Corchorus olitorius]